MVAVTEEDSLRLENHCVAASHCTHGAVVSRNGLWAVTEQGPRSQLLLQSMHSQRVFHGASSPLSFLLGDGLTDVFLESHRGPETWTNW